MNKMITLMRWLFPSCCVLIIYLVATDAKAHFSMSMDSLKTGDPTCICIDHESLRSSYAIHECLGSASKIPVYPQFDGNDTLMKETFHAIVEGGYSITLFNRGEDYYRTHVILGGRISQTFSLGVGIGRRIFDNNGGGITPFFLDLRTDFLPTRNSGYFAFQIGKSFGSSKIIKPGMLLAINFGYSHVYSPRNRLYVGLNIDVQFGKLETNSGGIFSPTTKESSQYLIAPGLTAGISF